VPAEMTTSNHQSKTARRAIKSTSGASLLKKRKGKKCLEPIAKEEKQKIKALDANGMYTRFMQKIKIRKSG
jgi:hypothetical protein